MRLRAYALSFLILLAASLSACSPQARALNTHSPGGESQKAYVETLRQKPPEDLTEEEIAYLQLDAEERTARNTGILAGIAIAGLAIAVVGATIAIGGVNNSDQ